MASPNRASPPQISLAVGSAIAGLAAAQDLQLLPFRIHGLAVTRCTISGAKRSYRPCRTAPRVASTENTVAGGEIARCSPTVYRSSSQRQMAACCGSGKIASSSSTRGPVKSNERA